MHKAYRLAEHAPQLGRLKEYSLKFGGRVDFIDIEKGIIYELKPNNARAIASGKRQLERYRIAAEKQFEKPFSGILDTY